MDGWIKLHRQIQECDLWESEEEPFDRRSAWIDLLLLANHRDKQIIFDGKPLTVGEGQRITSYRKLANRWNWSVERVKRYLKLLETLGMIKRESDNRKTLLTIVNYSKFQNEQHSYEYSYEYSDEYSDETLTSTQTRHSRVTNKNDKNEKNEKNDKKVHGEYAHVRLTDPELEKLNNDFGEDLTQSCITYLDEYIEMKGYKAKNHYLCIRKWVVDAVRERKQKTKSSDPLEKSYEMMSKWAEEE